MAIITERFQPSFVRWPIQNNRTGLQPVNIPLVLVVPYVRTPSGFMVSDSGVTNLKYFIEDAPGKTPVAGFENAGLFRPEFERFVRLVSQQELLRAQIRVESQQFFDRDTGEEKSFEDVVSGDFFAYTLVRGITSGTGARDRIEYFQDADYFDLSSFIINTGELRPYGRYNFVWQGDYNRRLISPNNELICISDGVATARFRLLMAHPGEVHEAIINNTPELYFGSTKLEDDDYVKFTRPFADILQDVFDEQTLLEGINWVDRIPAQLIPYLSYLLGWDLPFFPGATDKVRRTVLNNARRLQQLKGSKRVLIELFEMFGFTIDIINLWYSRDGSQFIEPGELSVGPGQPAIDVQEVCQTEPLVSQWNVNGFGQIEVPMLFKSDSNITVEAWLISDGSSTEDEIITILDKINLDPESLEAASCPVTQDGFIVSTALTDAITGPVLGYSQVLVSQRLGIGLDDNKVNEGPLSKEGIRYDKDTNILTINFDHYIEFTNSKLYIFATYKREKIIVPPSLADLRSNRFDIQVLFKSGEQPTSQLYEFLLDFIFRLKAFHSLLRKIIITETYNEVYNVADFCIGGDVKQRKGTDLGELQAVPSIIPNDLDDECVDLSLRGFSEKTLQLRSDVIDGLEREHEVWKNLDGTHIVPESLRPIFESLSRVEIRYPDITPCEFNEFGQDRILDESNEKDFDNIPDTRSKLCSINGNVSDYCYKGRVGQELDIDRILILPENQLCRPCDLTFGRGFYYTANPVAESVPTSGYDRCDISSYGVSYLHTLFTQVKAFKNAQIHYTDRDYLIDDLLNSNEFFAIRRPSLLIEKDNFFFPGHRYAFMNKIEDDFTHPDYEFRPWDDIFYMCPEYTITGAPTFADLNLEIIEDSNGDEYLVFNFIPLIYFGNGLIPDISNFSVHSSRSFTVTHAIYSSAETRDAIDHFDSGDTVFTAEEAICLGESFGPIFESANRSCVCENSETNASESEGTDFIDGYPALINNYKFDVDDIDYPRGSSSDIDLELLLDLPGSDIGTEDVELLFKFGSGILLDKSDPQYKFYAPHRFDCGCTMFGCDITTPAQTVDRCNIEWFIDKNGNLDPNCDRVEVDIHMILSEMFGTCSLIHDNTIPNSLCFDAEKIDLPLDEKFPSEGRFFFVDTWGVIHTGMFEVIGNRIDITTTTNDPRVWGEEQQGFIKNRKVFRRGISTTCRQIIEVTEDGYVVLAEGCDQKIEFFQTNFGCGDEMPSDPFAFHYDCGLLDEVEMDIIDVSGSGGSG